MSKQLEKSLGKAMRRINSAVKTGTIRAMNRAADSARSQMAKTIRDETGLPLKRVNTRVGTTKANSKRFFSSVNVATKVGIPLDEFKPKISKIRLPAKPVSGRRGRPRQRVFHGVTVKIGGAPRELVSGGFLTKVKNGKTLVLARKRAISSGSYDNQAGGTKARDRRPTTRLRQNVILKAAQANAQMVKKQMQSVFEKNIGREIDFASSR